MDGALAAKASKATKKERARADKAAFEARFAERKKRAAGAGGTP